MPVSTKKIIEYIHTLPHSFSKNTLIERFVERDDNTKSKKKSKKRKNTSHKKSLAKIDETIHLLSSLGFIKKIKKKYQKIAPFIITGTIQVNTSGNGIIETEYYNIVVKKEHTKHAQNNDTVVVSIYDYKRGALRGKVIKVKKRKREQFIARVVKKTKGLIFYKILDAHGNTTVCSERLDEEPYADDTVVIRLEDGTLSGNQKCSIVSMYITEDESQDVERIINMFSLPGPHGEYEQLNDIEKNIPKSEKKNRKNYSRLYTITIDGETAKDFDDAISLASDKDTITLYVHIADVSAYIPKNSTLDREAMQRGTSYYLAYHVIPMLPEALSNGLCSLKQDEKRLTMSVEMVFNKEGELLSSSFHRGTIKVNKRLTYQRADEILETQKPKKLYELLHEMYDLSQKLKKKRIQEGRLDLNLTDEEMIFEDVNIKDIVHLERLKSHTLIEEFMLSANVCVAKILKEKKIPTLYRVHEPVSKDSFATLKNFLRLFNVKLSKTGSIGSSIQKILEQVRGQDYEHVVNLVILKSMQQAFYGPEPLGHFGLGFPDYAHFTSPIRRYPDLVVHRCLKSLIDNSENPYPQRELYSIGEKNSEMERLAQKAERNLVKLKSCRLMKPRIGDIFDAIISGVTKYGFYITLMEMPIEGMVPLKFLTDDYYLVNEDEYTIIGKKYSKRFRLGDSIQVQLHAVDLELIRMDFKVAE